MRCVFTYFTYIDIYIELQKVRRQLYILIPTPLMSLGQSWSFLFSLNPAVRSHPRCLAWSQCSQWCWARRVERWQFNFLSPAEYDKLNGIRVQPFR